MPIYRYHIDVPLSPMVATERLQSVTLEPLGFFKYVLALYWLIERPRELFIGRVINHRFNICCLRIRYHNPFLPRIRGRITASEKGSHIDVLMYMNPFVAAFVAFWLFKVVQILFSGGIPPLKIVLWGITIFMVGFLMTIGSFVNGALKAKNLLTNLWFEEDTKILVDSTSLNDKVKCYSCGHFNANNNKKCLYCGADIVSV